MKFIPTSHRLLPAAAVFGLATAAHASTYQWWCATNTNNNQISTINSNEN